MTIFHEMQFSNYLKATITSSIISYGCFGFWNNYEQEAIVAFSKRCKNAGVSTQYDAVRQQTVALQFRGSYHWEQRFKRIVKYLKEIKSYPFIMVDD